jgi:hypothetical protein
MQPSERKDGTENKALSAKSFWHMLYCLGLVADYGMDPRVGITSVFKGVWRRCM